MNISQSLVGLSITAFLAKNAIMGEEGAELSVYLEAAAFSHAHLLYLSVFGQLVV